MGEAYGGGCACGANRYETPDEPMAMVHCQCRDCQQVSGTGHGSYLAFARGGVTLKGEPGRWDIVADSGHVKTRAFCSACGTPLYFTFAAAPDLIAIHAGSLDDPTRFKPHMVTYGMRGHAWDRLDPALQIFEKMPPD